MLAAATGSVGLVWLLLSYGADVNVIDSDGGCVLDHALPGTDDVYELLKEKGATELDSWRTRPAGSIMRAVTTGDLPRLRHLVIAAGVDPNSVCNGDFPLRRAAQDGHADMVEFLLQRGAEVDKRDMKFGATSLLTAAANGHTGIVNMLLAAGAGVNAVALHRGFTSLWMASQNGHLEVVSALIAAGANVDIADMDGDTPLAQAARYRHLPVAEVLIRAGANKHTYGVAGATPMLLSIIRGSVEMVELLLRDDAEGFSPVRDDLLVMAEQYDGDGSRRQRLVELVKAIPVPADIPGNAV